MFKKITLPSFVIGEEPRITAAAHTASFAGKKKTQESSATPIRNHFQMDISII